MKNYNDLTTSVGFREVEADGTFCIFVTAFTAFELWVTLSVGDPGHGKSGGWHLEPPKIEAQISVIMIRCRPPPARVGGYCMQSMSLFTNHKSPYCDRSGDINWRFPFFQGLILNSENDTVIMKTKKTESTNKSWWPSSWRWRWPVVMVVHHAGADRRGGGFIANEDKQNVKHPKHKDLETAKHVGEADNKLNDLVLLDMKLLAHPSHINRRPQSLHFDLADFLDLSEGKLERELLAVFVHVLFDVLWHWMCPWFLVHDMFSCIYAKTYIICGPKTKPSRDFVQSCLFAMLWDLHWCVLIWCLDVFGPLIVSPQHDVHVQAERLKRRWLSC